MLAFLMFGVCYQIEKFQLFSGWNCEAGTQLPFEKEFAIASGDVDSAKYLLRWEINDVVKVWTAPKQKMVDGTMKVLIEQTYC